MEAKLFEVRDRATFMPVIAIALTVREFDPMILTEKDVEEERRRKDAEMFLLRRVGYSRERLHEDCDSPYILLTRLDGGTPAEYDEYAWGNRTWHYAHHYINENWTTLKSGDVIDVEYILNESNKPKESERVTVGDYR